MQQAVEAVDHSPTQNGKSGYPHTFHNNRDPVIFPFYACNHGNWLEFLIMLHERTSKKWYTPVEVVYPCLKLPTWFPLVLGLWEEWKSLCWNDSVSTQASVIFETWKKLTFTWRCVIAASELGIWERSLEFYAVLKIWGVIYLSDVCMRNQVSKVIG